MVYNNLKDRTKRFSLRIIRLSKILSGSTEADVIRRQIVRSATSVASNYRAACRAKSRVDFIAKMGIVEEEADETLFWLEMIIECGLVNNSLLIDLVKEANEIMSIIVTSRKTARKKNSS